MKKGNLSTQAMLGVKNFSRNGIQTDSHGEIVYFLVKPTNISVLSRVSVGQKVKQLMQLLTVQPDLEVICLDARENFDDNKLYLDARLENEPNALIRDLLAARLEKALDKCMYTEKKLVVTGRSDGATCAEFADYVMENL